MDNKAFEGDQEKDGGSPRHEKHHHGHQFLHFVTHHSGGNEVNNSAENDKEEEKHHNRHHFLNVLHHHSGEYEVNHDEHEEHPHGHRHSHNFFHIKHRHGDQDLHVSDDLPTEEVYEDRKGSDSHHHHHHHHHLFHFGRHHSHGGHSVSSEVRSSADFTMHGRKELMDTFHHLIPPPKMSHAQRFSAPNFQELHKHGFEWPSPGSDGMSSDGQHGLSHDGDDMTCGVGKWRPQCLQRFATPWSFIGAYGVSTVLQGMYFTYFLAVITTIENRFEISSQTTGVVMSGNEASEIMFALLLTYYGGKGHRPHWISWGIWCTSIACFIMASPHFFLSAFSSVGEFSDTADLMSVALNGTEPHTSPSGLRPGSICLASEANATTMAWRGFTKTGGDCSHFGNHTMRSLILIFLSFFVAGLGIAVVQPLGLSYYDDNVPPSQAPMFHGVLSLAKVLGPFLGYILGSSCLRIYETPWNRPTGMKLEDPRWIGAWWLGFVIIGFALIVPGFITFLFPKKMRVSPMDILERARVERMTSRVQRTGRRTTIAGTIASDKEIAAIAAFQHRLSLFSVAAVAARDANEAIPSLKEIYAAVKRLVTNRLFMCHLIALDFQLLANVGFFTFSPKYLESQFRVSAATSNLAVGVAGVLVMASGMLLAGIVIRKFQPRPRVLTAYHICVTACCIAGLIGASMIGCTSLNHFGEKDESTGLLNMTNQCNVDCHCTLREHNVVCVEELGIHFYNPCYAGCSGEQKVPRTAPDGTVSNKTVYTGCTCGAEAAAEVFAENPEKFKNISVVGADEREWTFTSGYCRESICPNFIFYLLMLASVKIVASTARVGNLMITVRSVEKRDKSIAVGLTLVIFSLFGFIPTPIIYGAIVDSTCLVWSTTDCGSQGNCGMYDTARFRTLLHLTPAALMLVSLCMDVVVWYFSKGLDLYLKDSGVEPHHDTKKSLHNDD